MPELLPNAYHSFVNHPDRHELRAACREWLVRLARRYPDYARGHRGALDVAATRWAGGEVSIEVYLLNGKGQRYRSDMTGEAAKKWVRLDPEDHPPIELAEAAS